MDEVVRSVRSRAFRSGVAAVSLVLGLAGCANSPDPGSPAEPSISIGAPTSTTSPAATTVLTTTAPPPVATTPPATPQPPPPPAPATTTKAPAPPPPAPKPKPAPQPPAPKPACDPNYGGCVPVASDVDCAGGSGNGPAYVSGPIRVTGSDIYDLDRDNDGIACED